MRELPSNRPSPPLAPAGWPPEMAAALALIADLAIPAAVAWGESRQLAPNAAFGDAIGGGRRSFDALWGDDWPTVSIAAQAAIAGRAGVLDDVGLPGAARGDLARCALSLSPIRIGDGSANGLLVILYRLRSAAMGRPSGAEQLRRVRNLSARMRAIVTRSAQTRPDARDFADHLVARSDTLFRIEAFLSQMAASAADIEDVIRDEMRFRAAPEHCFTVSGPEVLLPAHAIEMMMLAFHELATNSVQFGVLGGESGTIEILWTITPEAGARRMIFEWRERPGPSDPAGAPGFGTEMLTQWAPDELGGAGTFAVLPQQVSATLSFPLNG